MQWYRQQQFYDIERETLIWLWIKQNLCEDDSDLSCAFLGAFPAIEQLDLLATYTEVDSATFDDCLFDDCIT